MWYGMLTRDHLQISLQPWESSSERLCSCSLHLQEPKLPTLVLAPATTPRRVVRRDSVLSSSSTFPSSSPSLSWSTSGSSSASPAASSIQPYVSLLSLPSVASLELISIFSGHTRHANDQIHHHRSFHPPHHSPTCRLHLRFFPGQSHVPH